MITLVMACRACDLRRSPCQFIIVHQHIKTIQITVLDDPSNNLLVGDQVIDSSSTVEEVDRIAPTRVLYRAADCLVYFI